MATTVVLGAGPGLGMSIARRFAKEGHAVALVSRSGARHRAYLDALGGTGAAAFTADITDSGQLTSVLGEVVGQFGGIDVLYYGPADAGTQPHDIATIGADDVRRAMGVVYPAIDAVRTVVPAMLARGSGALLFAGGLSGKVPMPGLGELVPASAALRQYVLALHDALAPNGVYAGALTIGGLIERGDIHAMITAAPERYGDLVKMTLDPDAIADVAWRMYTERNQAEEVFSAF